MTVRAASCLLVALVLPAGCGTMGRSPMDAPGAAHLATRFCGFVFDNRANEARFSLDLAVGRPVPAGSTIEVTFENPQEGSAPVTVTRELKEGERELRIVSTPVKGIREREYEMVARLYASPDRRTLLATHSERCRAPFGERELGIRPR